MTVGVLALQGDFAEHIAVLQTLHTDAREVRTPADLSACDRLIIPGGESTVISKLLRTSGLWGPLLTRAKGGDFPIYGTCAGAILLASNLTGKNPPETLKLMDITVDRNAYGTQLQSFDVTLEIERIGKLLVSFIRAPKITCIGANVEVLATHAGDPVLVREGKLLAGTFHPEVRGQSEIHKLFLSF